MQKPSNISENTLQIFVASNLQTFFDDWKNTINGAFILNTTKNGFRIDFRKIPGIANVLKVPNSFNEINVTNLEIQKLRNS